MLEMEFAVFRSHVYMLEMEFAVFRSHVYMLEMAVAVFRRLLASVNASFRQINERFHRFNGSPEQ